MTSLRRIISGALATVTLMALVGCAQLPHNSAIQQGPSVQNGSSSDYLYYSPSGPVAGQDIRGVLSGFINAATGPQNDYAIAREYLTGNLRNNWSPNTEVLIQQGSLDTAVSSDNTASVTVNVSARIDANGHYETQAPGTKRILQFGFKKMNGQWRISQAPDAIVLIRPVFDVIFHSYSVYFFDHSYNYLVPDLRWFPARASTATRLVTAILNGPSSWLAPATEKTMPYDTKLAIDAVGIDGNTAVVNLNAAALRSTQSQRQYFKAQLKATLTQLSGVSKVQILIERSPQQVADFAPATADGAAYSPVALIDDALTQLSAPAGAQIGGTRSLIRQVAATDFALTDDKHLLALRSTAGVYRVRMDQSTPTPVLVDSRPNTLKPIFDSRGIMWSVTTDGTAAIQVTPESGTSVWMTAPWLAKYTIRDYSLSNEGARMAFVIVNKKGLVKTVVSAVVRNKLGIPVAIGNPQVIASPADVVSVDWAGETNLLVLATDAAGESSVESIPLSGVSKSVGNLSQGVSIMSADSGANVFVLTKANTLLQFRGYAWTLLADRVTAAHMPN
jgi:hypothetical protein